MKDYIVGSYAGDPINTIKAMVPMIQATMNTAKDAIAATPKMPRIILISVGQRWGVRSIVQPALVTYLTLTLRMIPSGLCLYGLRPVDSLPTLGAQP